MKLPWQINFNDENLNHRIYQIHTTLMYFKCTKADAFWLTLFVGAAMGSEKPKNGKARLTKPFL